MIEPGAPDQIIWGDGNWIIWDVGFATSAPSSGLFIPRSVTKCYRFGDAKRLIVGHVKDADELTNLVIEAPLSVCFNKDGNPARRTIETIEVEGETQYRDWHRACGIMIAAMYVVRAIVAVAPKFPIRLFEGFVSYKDPDVKTDHCRDVELLRDVIKAPDEFAKCIHPGESLRGDPTNSIESAFKLCGVDCGVPAVIKREVPRIHLA